MSVMSTKEIFENLEELFKKNEKDYVSYEDLMELFVKQPTPSTVKKISALLKKYKILLTNSAEIAKIRNIEEAQKREEARQKLQDEGLEEVFDFTNEKELLSGQEVIARLECTCERWVKYHF